MISTSCLEVVELRHAEDSSCGPVLLVIVEMCHANYIVPYSWDEFLPAAHLTTTLGGYQLAGSGAQTFHRTIILDVPWFYCSLHQKAASFMKLVLKSGPKWNYPPGACPRPRLILRSITRPYLRRLLTLDYIEHSLALQMDIQPGSLFQLEDGGRLSIAVHTEVPQHARICEIIQVGFIQTSIVYLTE